MPNPTKHLRNHRQPNRPSLPVPAAADPAARLLLPLEQLAADTWLLAQKSPALPADPALLEAANRLLPSLRRLGPERRLVPRSFAPGIRLHALALELRQLHAALDRHLARRAPPPPRSTDDEIDDITRLQALILRGLTSNVAERHNIKLPPDLRPETPPPEPPAPGQPPAPRPHIRRSRMTRENTRRRTTRVPPAAAPVAVESPPNRPFPRIR
jgi:hypothetical protein